MTRLILALPLALLAAPVAAEDWRATVLGHVSERTQQRIDARDTLPAGPNAEARLDVIDTRLDRRAEVGAPRLRPDIRLERRSTRIGARLAD